MALDTAFYLVTKEIAQRSGLIDVRYRTLDNRFILDNKDLSRVRFTTDEYVSGLQGVEKISESEAQTLIAKGGYKKGLMKDSSPITESIVNEAPLAEETNSDQEVVEDSAEPTEDVSGQEQDDSKNEQEKEEE